MKKIFLAFILTLLFPLVVLADSLSISVSQEIIRPGKSTLITFDVESAGMIDLVLQDNAGTEQSVIVRNLSADAGTNHVWWNGTYNGVAAAEGDWNLVLIQNGETASCPVTVGTVYPIISGVRSSAETISPSSPVTISFTASVSGQLTVGVWQNDQWTMVEALPVEVGANEYLLTGSGLEDGDCVFTLFLTNTSGEVSDEERLSLSAVDFVDTETMEIMQSGTDDQAEAVGDISDSEGIIEDSPSSEDSTSLSVTNDLTVIENDQSQYTPSYGSPYAGTDTSVNYWTLPMDITDEDAVWAMLTAPITVVDIGSKSSQKVQAYLRAMPDEDADPVGVVTCETQGVHVLETLDNGWSLVECYSSSFHNTKVKAWNTLVQGYIKTSWLKEVTPNQTLGFVVDKLTQRLYIFREGKLYTTLLVSTGLSNTRQPYNETRSGEFITASKVGEFRSDNLYCSMAIRFNSGDLLHEVPHTLNSDGSSNYRSAEAKLGTKASHGCIRVQRRKTPEGVNMSWIWNNIKGSSKVRLIVWEDWQGRQISVPDDDFQLYYNPNGGKYYHSAETCYSASGKTFTAFHYGQLEDEEFASLDRCQYCAPVLRKAEIEEINATYAPGGDHDPVLTAAREEYFSFLETVTTDLLH